MYINDMSCCGVGEFDGLSGCTNYAHAIHNAINGGKAFMIYTMPRPYTKANGLTAYIRRHRLGPVTVSRPRKNYNSGRMLRVYTWTLNRDALKRWAAAHPDNRSKDDFYDDSWY